ncbi:uncharacterized protein CANTADRAFT_6090 [Suhomyces tanzawaensis NRRL Y-17324]|uniref:Ndc10 domain-containing protein n=1 Tax=Suhomyces tanzawaensis NRRL Y-17324 TaxID=984487 RepID=A0A1E4SHD0_9ASCO|nr:uncharacterized protein CANTADRAFT_6090 [Suhomyces tanzawaensis NRRL Y-17324]ODV78885.1 hypothetical protein CANTADRAFT_6090 [Suhomyces tanzawaensis NRRL Y-17324]
MSPSPIILNHMSDSDDSSNDQNEYTITDYFRLIRPLWEFQQESTYLDHQKLLRTILDFSLTHSISLRNLQKRELELGDIDLADSNLDTIVIRTKNNSSLSNLEHPYVFHGALRNKYVELCPHFALSAYLFSRFHVADTYGSLELQLQENTNLKLEEIKLLKGSHKLSGISYSQQHKSAISALQLSKLTFKDINLNKLLSTQDFDDCERMLLLQKTHLPMQTMVRVAGFDSIENYNIVRDSIEPPEELMELIFPFLSFTKAEFTTSPGYEQLKKVLIRLRRSMCQDMVLIKRLYPNNCLSKHPIFNTDIFNNFAKEMVFTGVLDKSPLFTLPIDYKPADSFSKPQSFSSDRSSNSESSDPGQFQKLISEQNDKINNLEKLVCNYNDQHKFIYSQLSDYISKQNEVFQSQSELLQKIQNTTTGLLVLISSRNKNMIPLAQLSLQETTEHLSTVGTSNLRQGINNTMELLGKLNDFNLRHVQMTQTHVPPLQQHPHMVPTLHQPPPGPPPSHSYAYKGHYLHSDLRLQTHTTRQVVPTIGHHSAYSQEAMSLMTADELKRQSILNRRLSRQASTLFEMWDDFKSLEKDLKDHEITMTEWLKVHGSSERQFRHTRLKIIKFIEDEAARTHANVEYIKQKLHDKMRNRLRPWTLDEVQRMLTSGKRIQLDD